MPSDAPATVETHCLVVGGGPAGMMAGYLFARAGVDTVVLEKHGDFLRDFRGDTVHPSTLEIMRELGLLEEFLKRPHQKLERLSGQFGDRRVRVVDLTRLPTQAKYIALMPQWDFLDFLSDHARTLPSFRLMMNTEATDLLIEDGRVVGARAKGEDGPVDIRADLTIGADGRHSRMREAAGLKVDDLGAPIDVLWFRVPRDPENADNTLLYGGRAHIVVTIDRGDYWQCAFVIPKGKADEVRRQGIAAFRETVARTAPPLAGHVETIRSFDEVKLLTVTLDRLETWSRPGMVMIGDGAHAMSPIGGVGINLAIQDAVACANLFAEKLGKGALHDDDLDALRDRRLFPTRIVQFVQRQIQNGLIHPIVSGRQKEAGAPLMLRIADHSGWLRGMIARFLGLGIRREHVRSPEAIEGRPRRPGQP